MQIVSQSGYASNQFMSLPSKLTFFTFDFEQASSSLTSATDETKAKELAYLAKNGSQPWLNENDESMNFESAEMTLEEITELTRQFENKFEPALAYLFEYLGSGRSFSGQSFSEKSNYYAYLSKTEVEEMRVMLQDLYEEGFGLLDRGAFCKVDFDSQMLEVMESLLLILKQADGCDLFVTTS